jgi:hypothetical protein
MIFWGDNQPELYFRKNQQNYQNLLRTFIETFTLNFIQIRLVVLKKKIPENGKTEYYQTFVNFMCVYKCPVRCQ